MSKHRVVLAALVAAAFSTAVFAADAKKSPTLADKTAAKAHDKGAADAGTPAATDAGTAKPAAPKK